MESWKRNNSLRRVRENDHEKSITGFELQSILGEIELKYDRSIHIMPEFNDNSIFNPNPIITGLKISCSSNSNLSIKDLQDYIDDLNEVLDFCENFEYIGYKVSRYWFLIKA